VRTGNAADAKAKGWSPWSAAQNVGDSVALEAPAGRFLQYKLVFTSVDGKSSAAVHEVRLSYLTPNLPPRLTSVEAVSKEKPAAGGSVSRSGDMPPCKEYHRTIRWSAEDENEDALLYDVWIRPAGAASWVKTAKDLQETQWQWDTQTVADGRYEVKVEVSDRLDNLAAAALRDERVSDPVLVDNSPAFVEEMNCRVEGHKVILDFTVSDDLSAIARVAYAVDSAEEWQMLLPADEIYDSRTERMQAELEIPDAGSHWLAVRVDDEADNATYRNLSVEIQP